MKINLEVLGVSQKGNYTLSDMAICMVTHPNQPNTSGLARGRSIHLSKDGKKSLCNMNVENFFKQNNWAGKKFCKICFKDFLTH